MRVWVNVWGKVTLRWVLLTALAACAVGCIDDFDNPKGYGPRGGSSTNGENDVTCSDVCARAASCDSGSDTAACRQECVEITNISRRGGCTDELDDLVECFAELSNVCRQLEACGFETDRLYTCIENYCLVEPADCPF